MLTVDEYLALRRLIESERESEGAKEALSNNNPNQPKKRTRKRNGRDKILSQELKIMNKRYRKKDGSLRSGATQRKIMQMAQKATNKRMRKK